MFVDLFVLNFFINSTKHNFFLNKNCFLKFNFQIPFFIFFWKHQKPLFKTILKNINHTDLKFYPLYYNTNCEVLIEVWYTYNFCFYFNIMTTNLLLRSKKENKNILCFLFFSFSFFFFLEKVTFFSFILFFYKCTPFRLYISIFYASKWRTKEID